MQNVYSTTEVDSKIAAIQVGDIDDIVQYDVTQSLLYDINHIDLAINDIVSKMNQGDNLLLPHGNYNYTNTINITNEGLNDCKLIFDGILNQVGNFTAMNISADYCKIKINDLRTKIPPISDYSNIINDGIVLGECYHANLDINQMSGFKTGIKISPNNTLGVQYCKINFNEIYNCTTPILLQVGDTGASWINENTFIGGRLSGYYGLRIVKGLQQDDPYNNNKFYNIGFEGITSDAINLSYTSNNFFIGFRLSESLGSRYVVEDSSCQYNKFINSCPIYKSKIFSAAKNSVYDTPLFADDGSLISSYYVTTPYLLDTEFQFELKERGGISNGICLANITDTTLFNQFLCYVYKNNNRIHGPALYEQGTKVLANANFKMVYLYNYINITSNLSTVTVTIPNAFKYDGAQFTFWNRLEYTGYYFC